jgi:hypothetical protein
MTFGAAQGARADETEVVAASPQETLVAPIVQAIDALAQRMSSLEEGIAMFAVSFTSQRLATRQLCVADDSGAETCITRAQLDGLLKRVAQADVSEPSVTVAVIAPPAEPVVTEVAIADAVVTEAAATPVEEAIETLPATEVLADASNRSDQVAVALAQEPEVTGSAGLDTEGAALVWHPDVEITIAAAAAPDQAAPSDE